jgi:2-keto-4-pentenoate hydratase/2-oxohepta-3-ene-1,7-dioic acid hydratase in catechol pathway
MRRTYKSLLAVLAMAVVACSEPGPEESQATLQGQPGPSEPYKLGMFRQDAGDFVGLVVGDELVVDLSRAGVGAPATLHELIASWDPSMADRLGSLAGAASRQAPEFSYRLSELKTLPPITDPDAMVNAARNYEEHAAEMAATGRTAGTTTVVDETVRSGIPALWSRLPDDVRPNPYLFPKLKSAITGNGDPIILPPGRTWIDWECELTVVIGKTLRRVPREEVMDYVFGYTLMLDVSDREDRLDLRYGSDWLLGKSQDTFAPLGPFVVPAAFVPDPQNLGVQFSLNGELMQDATTSLMTHTVVDLLTFASNMVTLRPGDLMATGTPAGVGTARVPPIYLEAGDRTSCTIEGIGTLSNTVEALSTDP